MVMVWMVVWCGNGLDGGVVGVMVWMVWGGGNGLDGVGW